MIYDLAIVGSAFGGALLSMVARRLGRSVVLIERDRHPKFAIGESSTPLTNLMLEELARRYDLPRISAFSKWGSWQRSHPQIAAGLKRGFSFYHHVPGQAWQPEEDRSNELMVAASPNDEVADTHWYRPDFDAFLVQEAMSLGVAYQDQTHLDQIVEDVSGVTLSGRRHGVPIQYQARFLVDASGARGFLWKALGLGSLPYPDYPSTEGLFTHFQGVKRWEDLISRSEKEFPFPPDDAALHHVFPGGWIWVLRFNNGITSAGVSMESWLARELALEHGAPAWSRLLERFPSIALQFQGAQAVEPFHYLPSMSFQSARLAGRSWALLPSSAGFLDPLLSTGFPITLLGIQRLADLWEQETQPSIASLEWYAEETRADLLMVARLVGSLHQNLGRPAVFESMSMLYFAAAIFSETTRRLGKYSLSPGFLLRGREDFRKSLERLCGEARKQHLDPVEFAREVARAIAPFNVAGLMNPQRRHWYPMDLEPLYASSATLGVTREEITSMLVRCGCLTR